MPIVHHLENIENLIQRQTQRLLLVRLQKGDFEVLDDLLTQTHTYFYNLLACMLGPNIDSNNILKHAFHRFIQIRDRLDSHREFVPILGRIIFEEAASAAQKKKRMRLTFSRDEQEAYIVNLFQSLPLQQQIVLHFRIVGAMHYEDIAISLRIRQSDVFSHLAEGRQLIYNSLYKKRLIANPEHIDVEEQKIILAHPDLLELKKYAPKISKNFENSANLHHFLDQVRLVDMMVRNALATVSNESAKLASRRRHVLQYLRQELRNEQAPQQPLDNTKSIKFRPVWRTAFALVVAVASFFLWNLYKPALQQITSPQIIQNSTLPIFTNTTEASSTKAVPDSANTGTAYP